MTHGNSSRPRNRSVEIGLDALGGLLSRLL